MSEIEKKEASNARLILTLGLEGMMAGILIVAAFHLTLPRINIQKEEFIKKSVLDVLPNAKEMAIYKVTDSGEVILMQKEEKNVKRIYAGYDQDKQLVGIAIQDRGQGFQDAIVLIYGYSPQKQCIVGMKVLETKETPGLGDKIEKDDHFKANFQALEVTFDPQKKEIVHPITVVKKGSKTEKWQIDAITGATISSNAVGKILKQSTQQWIPIIHDEKNLEKLKARK